MDKIGNPTNKSFAETARWDSVEDIPQLRARAAFTSENADRVFREDYDITPTPLGRYNYIPWGADNGMPFDIMDLIERDETFTTCLQFQAELCYGSGLRYNTDYSSPKVRNDVQQWLLDNNLPAYFMGVCQDFKTYGFAVSVIVLDALGQRIVSISRKHACYCRFTAMNRQGRIENVLYANWRLPVTAEEDVEAISLLSPEEPWRDLAVRMGRIPGADGLRKQRTAQRKFAILTKIPTPDSTYYPIPFYASLFRSKWYDIKQLIGTAKKSKLQNSAPLKYHIEIASRYWEKVFVEERITDPRQKQERVARGKQQILDFLTGVENSGKAWFSTFYLTPDGREMSEVRISKIDTDKEGGDWESDIQEAINVMCFALRVHSNLVGSVPGKAQTNNSGSDKRELYTIAQALQKPYHDLLFLPHRIIMRFNGWQGAFPECPFIELTTLDENTSARTVTMDNNKSN